MADITMWVKENSKREYIKCLYKNDGVKKSSDEQMYTYTRSVRT